MAYRPLLSCLYQGPSSVSMGTAPNASIVGVVGVNIFASVHDLEFARPPSGFAPHPYLSPSMTLGPKTNNNWYQYFLQLNIMCFSSRLRLGAQDAHRVHLIFLRSFSPPHHPSPPNQSTLLHQSTCTFAPVSLHGWDMSIRNIALKTIPHFPSCNTVTFISLSASLSTSALSSIGCTYSKSPQALFSAPAHSRSTGLPHIFHRNALYRSCSAPFGSPNTLYLVS